MADSTSGTIASTVASLPSSAAARFGPNVAARFKHDDQWGELTYAEFVEAIEEIALGLIDLGIEAGDRVCLLADTRLEWTLASFGDLGRGRRSSVPVYPTNSPERMRMGRGQLRRPGDLLRGRRGRSTRSTQVRDALPELEHVIGIEPGGAASSASTSCASEGARRRPRRAGARARTQVEPRRPLHDHLHVGHDRPPKGVRAHPRQRDGGLPDGRGARVRRARARRHLPVPAARPRLRAADAARDLRPGHARSSTSAATPSRSWPS